MPSTIPHAKWETLQTEAEDYAEHIKGTVEATLARMDADERRIFCNHLFQMAQFWGFEQEAIDHDTHYTHGKDCPCDECCNIFGVAF